MKRFGKFVEGGGVSRPKSKFFGTSFFGVDVENLAPRIQKNLFENDVFVSEKILGEGNQLGTLSFRLTWASEVTKEGVGRGLECGSRKIR